MLNSIQLGTTRARFIVPISINRTCKHRFDQLLLLIKIIIGLKISITCRYCLFQCISSAFFNPTRSNMIDIFRFEYYSVLFAQKSAMLFSKILNPNKEYTYNIICSIDRWQMQLLIINKYNIVYL